MASYGLYTLLTATGTATGTELTTGNNDQRTFQAVCTGSGSVTATVTLEGSLDKTNWVTIATLSLSGTAPQTSSYEHTSAWTYIRARTSGVSGTSATVNVYVALNRKREERISDPSTVTLDARDFGAKFDGVTDDTPAIQAAINAAIANSLPLSFPAGDCRLASGIVITVPDNESFKMLGAGANTRFLPDAFTGNVFEVRPNDQFNYCETVIGDFKIYKSSITSQQIGFAQTASQGTAGLKLQNIISQGFDVGFKFTGAQFCSFRGLQGTNNNVGVHLEQDATAGGGNNNTWLDCWFSYNKVGVFAKYGGTYPFHNNKFVNLTTHGNEVCAVYLNGGDTFSIENWAPEINGTGAATYSYDSETIKNGILHTDDAALVVLRDYKHVSSDKVINCDNGSIVSIDSGSGGEIEYVLDSTSQLFFQDAPFQTYRGSASNVVTKAPMFVKTGNMSVVVSVPVLSEAPWLTNDAIGVGAANVEYGYASGGTTATTAYVTDSEMGYVLQASFTTGQLLNITTSASNYTTVGTQIAMSFLAKSSSASAVWTLDWAQSTVNNSVFQLPANKWVRVFVFGELSTTPRSPWLFLTAAASANGETLKVCKIHSCTSLDAKTLARFAQDGLYNPGKFKTTEVRLSAAPSVGTWAVGDRVWNTAPAAGGTPGWVCTTAGSPGTWKAMANLAA